MIQIALGIGNVLSVYFMFKDDKELQPIYIYLMVPIWTMILSLPFITVIKIIIGDYNVRI